MTSPSIGMESLRRRGDGKDATSNPRRRDPGITMFCPGMTIIGKTNVLLLQSRVLLINISLTDPEPLQSGTKE